MYNELHPDRSAPLLPPRDALDEYVSDLSTVRVFKGRNDKARTAAVRRKAGRAREEPSNDSFGIAAFHFCQETQLATCGASFRPPFFESGTRSLP